MSARQLLRRDPISPGLRALSSSLTLSYCQSSQTRCPMLFSGSQSQARCIISVYNLANMLLRKGVADEELAKKEAERARKRALEEEDEEDTAPDDSPPKRRRSHSYDSVSTISTRSPSPAPPPRRVSRSPPRVKARDLSLSPRPSHSRRRSTASSDGHSSRLSRSPESPERGYSRRAPPDARSPSPPVRVSKRSRRGGHSGRDYGRAAPAERHYSRSRSPTRSPVGRRDQQQRPNYRDRDNHSQQGTRLPPRREPSPPPRERSLSPFSKRLALTQSMNMGR
ncbi:hypothetical protein B0T24DRAFT_622893 [Lasiosphaeria ovina]|uniref:Uncharacterized protein n=1 Tax=Lasiosphaeria ovina TaxID=92902 RepID=A0AAE0KBZ7_9PEZI|nr:hypothetical protein B0T24DRAFT_622893 [Lasiosphaeria ovina]